MGLLYSRAKGSIYEENYVDETLARRCDGRGYLWLGDTERRSHMPADLSSFNLWGWTTRSLQQQGAVRVPVTSDSLKPKTY